MLHTVYSWFSDTAVMTIEWKERERVCYFLWSSNMCRLGAWLMASEISLAREQSRSKLIHRRQIMTFLLESIKRIPLTNKSNRRSPRAPKFLFQPRMNQVHELLTANHLGTRAAEVGKLQHVLRVPHWVVASSAVTSCCA